MNKRLLGGLISSLLPVCGGSAFTPGAYSGYSRPPSQGKVTTLVQSSGRNGQSIDHAPQFLVAQSAGEVLQRRPGQPVQELVILDGAVADKSVFYRHSRPGVEVLEIDSASDGIQQLEALLGRYTGLRALHIVSHGDDGVLHLGNTAIDQSTLDDRPLTLQGIDRAMIDGGDVLLYGCSLAETENGYSLLELIAGEANVDVLASSDITGSSRQGGDWDLEVRVGRPSTNSPFSEEALRDFKGVLAINDGVGRTINTGGFSSGYDVTKSYDVDSSGYNFRISTNSADPESLYSGVGYVYANLPGNIAGLNTMTVDFIESATFDIDSLLMQAGSGTRNYVFTPSTGSPVTLLVSNSSLGTQTLNFTGIESLTIQRQDGGDLEFSTFGNFIIKNAATPDTTAPSFQNSTPSVSATTFTQTTLTVQLDEIGTAYYVVVPNGASAPSSTQVRAGNNASNAAAISNGSLNVTSGSMDFSASVTGLSPGTAYDLYVVAEDSIPNLQASPTLLDFSTSAQDSDGNLSSAGGVSEPVALAFTADTVGEAVDLFDFTISDGGGGDGLALGISQVVVNVSGTASDTDRNKITWRLNGTDASNITGTYSAGANTITFDSLSLSVAEGAAEVYTINGYFNDNTGLTAGNTVILTVDGDTDLTISGSGTQMGSTSAITNGSGTIITDDIAPTVTSVAVPANATYTQGQNLDFTVNFDEFVTANTGSGTPRLPLTIGSTSRSASYITGSPGTALVFRYTVMAGDEDLNGIDLGANLDPNLGAVTDSSGNNVNTTLNSVGSLSSVFVDASAPAVTEVTPVVTPGNDGTPNVTFSVSEAGTLAVGGSCGSAAEGATSPGNNTITLTQPDNSTALASATYSDCTVTVTDAAANASDVLTLTAFTIDVDQPTVDLNGGKSLDEGDTGVTILATDLASSDNFSAAADLTYTLVGSVANGTLRNGGSPIPGGGTFTQANLAASALTYDHDGGETTSDTFTFSVSDAVGNVNSNSAANFTFTFAITGVNDAPETMADSDSTNEDNAVAVDVLANDNDVDGSLTAASVVVVSGPANGATGVNTGTGVITYTPALNFEGTDSFTYTVEDNDALASAATTVTITVNALNDPPVAMGDMASTTIGTLVAIDVAANDTDVDDMDAPDPATIVVVGAASNGSAVFNAGTNQVDYTPTGLFSGADSFTYTIDDGSASTSNIATVTVNVGDDVAPTVTSVQLPPDATYGVGQTLDFTVNFDEMVTVNTTGGTPRLALTVGAASPFANYVSGTGTSALLFQYTVQAGDLDADGIALGATLDPNSGTLRDGADNDAETSLGMIGSLAGVLVDAQPADLAEVTPVTPLGNNASPEVTFSSSEAGTLAVGGSCGSPSEGAIASGAQTITLAQSDNATPLTDGTFADCTLTVTDAAGNISADLTLSTFEVDLIAPVVTVDTLSTIDQTPPLSGTVDDTDATLSLSVGNQTVVPVNNQDGTWSLPDNTLSTLSSTTFDVEITATDAAGNAGVDASMDELSVTTVVLNLSIDKSDGETLVGQDDLLIYTIVALNRGPGDVVGAVVEDLLPPEIATAAWTCVPFGGATCVGSGTGDIQEVVDIPADDGVVFVLSASLDPVLGVNSVINTATITPPMDVIDTDDTDDSSSDSTLIEVLFRDEFETPEVVNGAAGRTLTVKRGQLLRQLDPLGDPVLLMPEFDGAKAQVFARLNGNRIELQVVRTALGRAEVGEWVPMDASVLQLRQ